MKEPKETPKPKSKAPLITPEIMQKMSRDGYCFNMEHEREIERLNKEVLRLEAQVALMKKEKDGVAKEIERLVGLREAELRKEKETVQDSLEETLKHVAEVQSDLEDEKAKVSALEAQILSTEETMKKKFKDQSLCFDIMHRMIRGRAMHLMTVPELFIFAIYLLSKSTNPADDVLIAVSREMVPDVDAAKRVVDVQQARKLGEELRKHPVMTSLSQKAKIGGDYGRPGEVKN